MEHTVRKSKKNRIALRSLAFIFIAVALLRVAVVVVRHERSSIAITLLCTVCLMYGIVLLVQTLKPQAYDITYVFGDKTMTLKMHRKERTIGYEEITDLGYVIPNPNLDYSLVQIYIGKEQFVIPFAEHINVGEALYGMLKLKKEECDNSEKDGE
ncbi:MAG: hypothetical protein K6G76_08935 [Lachnospiraceae bacterium]|nr:hypothetical protein [Lachnospiraceae bacterium]